MLSGKPLSGTSAPKEEPAWLHEAPRLMKSLLIQLAQLGLSDTWMFPQPAAKYRGHLLPPGWVCGVPLMDPEAG